ncbi:MAG: DNA polymerase IV [Anaerolineales bacterium]|jgi:DNA polymerase-4
MSNPRKIIHLDLDAFFCAVEEQHNPSLRNKAFAVGGRPEERGVVASCSYAARRFGVRSAMPMARALRLCPGLIIVSSRHGKYSQVSRRVMAHLREWTPLVEQISIDEAFLDVSDLTQPAESIARQVQAQVQKDPGLPCSLGVATNKLLAKTANDVGKASFRGEGPPNAITVVPPGQGAAFLAPLPVVALWGVGPKTAERLADLGIQKIGELASRSEVELMRLFGKTGYDLAQRARGIDDRPIVTSHAVKSISQEVTFAQDVRDAKVLERTLYQQAAKVGENLRHRRLTGTTVKIKLRWADFTTLTRQLTLDHSTDQDQEIFSTALALFHKTWQPGKPVRLLGVGVTGLREPIRQLSLWDDTTEKDRQLQTAIDQLRQRFGKQIVSRGGEIYNENLKE